LHRFELLQLLQLTYSHCAAPQQIHRHQYEPSHQYFSCIQQEFARRVSMLHHQHYVHVDHL